MHFLLVELFFIPICLGRIAVHAPSQQIEDKTDFVSKTATPKRALRPSLSIRTGPKSVTRMMAGEDQYLECEAGGTPPPSIHWLKDGAKIQGLSGVNAEVMPSHLGLGFTRSRLYFDCASELNAGVYTCVAENDYFKESRTGLVLVSPGENYALCQAQINAPAHILLWTHTRLEMMGTNVQLFCRTSGVPRPLVLWEGPDGNTLLDSLKYKVMENGDLIIRDIQWSDMGGYTCHVKNYGGSDEALVFLYPTLPDEEKSERA